MCPLGNFDLDFPVIPTTFLPYFTCYKNKSTYHNFTDVCVFWTLVNWIEPFSLLKFNWTKAFACRYKHFWANDHKTITYDRSKSVNQNTKQNAKWKENDRLITDHTLGDYLGNFDLEAGTFTAGTPGTMFHRVSPQKLLFWKFSRLDPLDILGPVGISSWS